MAHRRMVAMVLGLALCGLLFTGCATSGSTASKSAKMATSGCAGCSKMAADGTGWCDTCYKGVVAGKEVKCWGCYVEKTGGPVCSACAQKKESK